MLSTSDFSQAVTTVESQGTHLDAVEREAKLGSLMTEWQEYLVEENDISHLSDSVQSNVFALAYRFGMYSGYGYEEVERYYRTLAEFTRDAA